jgi:hypothetical protein
MAMTTTVKDLDIFTSKMGPMNLVVQATFHFSPAPEREASTQATDSGNKQWLTDSAHQNSWMRVQTMQVAIIAQENVILAGFHKRKSFGWALHPQMNAFHSALESHFHDIIDHMSLHKLHCIGVY